MKKENLIKFGPKETVVITIIKKDGIVRVSGNNKVRKYFHRTFGNDKNNSKKVIKALLENGLTEGKATLQTNDFLIVLDNIINESRFQRTVKKVRKAFKSEDVYSGAQVLDFLERNKNELPLMNQKFKYKIMAAV